MNDIHIPCPCRFNNTQCNFQRCIQSRVTPDSYHSTLSLRDNYDRVFSSRVTPDSYHSTLSLCDNLTVCFLLEQHNSSAYTSRLLHPYRNLGYLHGSLTPTQKFRISSRVSYTHTEIWDSSSCNTPKYIVRVYFGVLHLGSLTPSQKFGKSPRVSYTHTEIQDTSPGLLHPHRNSGYLPGSLTP